MVNYSDYVNCSESIVFWAVGKKDYKILASGRPLKHKLLIKLHMGAIEQNVERNAWNLITHTYSSVSQSVSPAYELST